MKPESEFIIPGFAKFPPWAKPTAWLPMPFPGQFLNALFRIPEILETPIPADFGEPWRERWLSISVDVSAQSKTKCSKFFHDGLESLKELASKGCNPNLIMSLLARYLWDEFVPPQECRDPNVLSHLADLKAIRSTRILFRNHTWKTTAETELVKRALEGLEGIVQSYVDELDFHTGRHLQNDKVNRVIFTIHHHLLKKKIGPQWRLMLDVLVAAEAISRNSTKRSKSWASGNPESRVRPHIVSFERDHPKEADLLSKWVSEWPSTFPLRLTD